jgi:general secretion pathway protein G
MNALPSSRTERDERGMTRDRRGGFTIMEVLIAVMIIGILATILIPVLTSRAKDARVAACESEIQTLVEAEKSAAISVGYLLRLYVLNDLPGRGKGISSYAPGGVDSVADEQWNVAPNATVSHPTYMFIDLTTNLPLSTAVAEAQYAKILRESMYGWKGPFCTFKRDEKNVEESEPEWGTVGPVPTHILGIPNDPWGNDYLLFVRGGIILEPMGVFTEAVVSNGVSYPANVFDRPTILSLGPDGMPGDGTKTNASDPDYGFGKGDDVCVSFEY